MVTKIITGIEINLEEKQISNPYSTGQGGAHFENRVQSAFTILLLTGGVAPCMPQWPIVEIKLQGKYQGYNVDDLIVHCQKPNSERKSKLLGQIKHKVKFTIGDQILSEVITAAWNDFTNPKIFSEASQDIIALICGPLSAIDTDSVRTLLEQARYSKNGDDLITRIELGKFTSNEQREKFNVFKHHLTNANNNIELNNEQIWRFLKSFYLLIYDLDIKGVALSLLHTLIEQYSRNNVSSVWAQINDHVQWVNENAGSITLDTIPEEIRKVFQKIRVEAIPEEFVKDTTKSEITDWNDYENASDLVVACLIGSWNENSPADKSILSQLAGLKYEKWIPKLRDVLQYPESPLELKNGIWFVKDRIKLWQSLSARIFDDHLDILNKCATMVLTERNPKFELPKRDQFAAQMYGKVLNYSNHIRKGLSEALALTSSYSDLLKNCSTNKPEMTAILVLREIFDQADWVLWASLNDLLPTLAEAAPDEFLKIVEDNFKNGTGVFDSLFAQEGNGVTGWNYMTGLLWALEALAWSETFLVRVTVLLGELANIDPGGNWMNRPSNSLTNIFLPWLPQTAATIDKRKVAIKTLDKELPEISWKLLLSLLPRKHQISSGSYKPKFRNYIPKDLNGKGI
ncbi:MAG: hypothetical protein M1480_03150 [Bacteroidetes bacterium]|nr:hypothetical protein [Bacteroidota bacterium]MCL5027997.1 hypothetical protein [Bacteroidota bacterium]